MSDTVPPALPPQPPVMPPGPPPGGAASGTTTLPWETPGYPALEALFETAKLFLTKPSEAFARMPATGDLGRPLLYAIVFGWVGVIASQLYGIVLRGAMWNFLPGMDRAGGLAVPTGVSIGLMVVAPILVVIGLFVGAAIVHLFLLLVGGATAGFGATLRTMAYASTTQVVQVIPFCGGFVAAIWALVLEIVGLAIVHRTTQGKAALAVLLPVALCCVCIAVAFALAGAAIWAAFKGLQ